jgi:hypothetical protein
VQKFSHECFTLRLRKLYRFGKDRKDESPLVNGWPRDRKDA